MDELRWEDKDPSAVKDYAVDWSDILVAGETITSSEWTVDGTELSILDDPAPSVVGSLAIVWLSGGLAYHTYFVKNTIVTSRGVHDERTVKIDVMDQ